MPGRLRTKSLSKCRLPTERQRARINAWTASRESLEKGAEADFRTNEPRRIKTKIAASIPPIPLEVEYVPICLGRGGDSASDCRGRGLGVEPFAGICFGSNENKFGSELVRRHDRYGFELWGRRRGPARRMRRGTSRERSARRIQGGDPNRRNPFSIPSAR